MTHDDKFIYISPVCVCLKKNPFCDSFPIPKYDM